MVNKVKRKMFFLISLLGLLIIFAYLETTDIAVLSFKDTEESNEASLNYETHDPIFITSTQDFIDYGFSGNGASGTPFIIANYSIFAAIGNCIEIKNINDYFIIENCYLEGSSGYSSGIWLYNIGNDRAIVRNNSIYSHSNGIVLEYDDFSQVRNNTIEDCEYSIVTWFGVGSIIQENTCINSKSSISIYDTDSIDIINNTCKDSMTGIALREIFQTSICNNSLINTGVYIEFEKIDDYSSLEFSNNTVNDLPISIIMNDKDKTIDSSLYGQIILLNCSGITVHNPLLTPTPNYGVHLFFSNSCTINHTLQVNNNIVAYFSPDTEISNNECNNLCYPLDEPNKQGAAIEAYLSNNTIIKDNTCYNYGQGVALYRSFNVEILRNTCDYNDEGIGIYSKYCTVEENVLNSNMVGISLLGSSTLNTSENQVTSNTVSNSIYVGIELRSYTKDNTIYNNFFINNYLGGTSQARDDGINNIWYNTLTNTGNYWSDWSGSGPYSIDGSAGAEDPYPLSSVPEFTISVAFLLTILVSSLVIIPLIKKRK